MTNGETIKLGWDRPLVVDWDFQLAHLRRCIQNHTPYASGALRHAFDNPTSAVINKEETVITVAVEPPATAARYAAIQNFGGPSRDIRIYPRFKKALSFMWHGRRVFFKSVLMRANRIRGKHFVENGVKSWLEDLMKGRRFTWVRWARKGETGGRPSL